MYLQFLLLLLFLFKIYSCSRVRNGSRLSLHQEANTTSSESFCPIYENCLFYQVNKNYTDYGCTVCQPEFISTADTTGAGFCKKKNPIKDCLGAQTRPDYNDGKPFCFQCKKDFALKNDSSACDELAQEDKKIDNCIDYYNNGTDLICNMCENGFTLKEDKLTCEEGCKVINCNNCQRINETNYCFNCKKGNIGVVDPTTLIYKTCLTCDEYQYNLEAINSTYRPR